MSQDDRRSACLRKAIELCRLIAPEPLTLDEIAGAAWLDEANRAEVYLRPSQRRR